MRGEELTGDNDDTGLAGAALRGPGEVARVETEGTVLVVATAGADDVDALGTDTGVRRLAARLEGSLLPCTQLSEIAFISIVRVTGSERMGSVLAAALLALASGNRQNQHARTFQADLRVPRRALYYRDRENREEWLERTVETAAPYMLATTT